MEFKRLIEEKNRLEVLKSESGLTVIGLEILEELTQVLQLLQANVSSIFFNKYNESELKDLIKVSEAREKILILIHSTDLHEDIIEYLLKPFEELLKYNGFNISEQDF